MGGLRGGEKSRLPAHIALQCGTKRNKGVVRAGGVVIPFCLEKPRKINGNEPKLSWLVYVF